MLLLEKRCNSVREHRKSWIITFDLGVGIWVTYVDDALWRGVVCLEWRCQWMAG